jgi:hypothetical protein
LQKTVFLVLKGTPELRLSQKVKSLVYFGVFLMPGKQDRPDQKIIAVDGTFSSVT